MDLRSGDLQWTGDEINDGSLFEIERKDLIDEVVLEFIVCSTQTNEC